MSNFKTNLSDTSNLPYTSFTRLDGSEPDINKDYFIAKNAILGLPDCVYIINPEYQYKLTFNENTAVIYNIIGGGGGGGTGYVTNIDVTDAVICGGGGGAGGNFSKGSFNTTSSKEYIITCGKGGKGATYDPITSSSNNSSSGGDSSITSNDSDIARSTGGGGGGNGTTKDGGIGGENLGTNSGATGGTSNSTTPSAESGIVITDSNPNIIVGGGGGGGGGSGYGKSFVSDSQSKNGSNGGIGGGGGGGGSLYDKAVKRTYSTSTGGVGNICYNVEDFKKESSSGDTPIYIKCGQPNTEAEEHGSGGDGIFGGGGGGGGAIKNYTICNQQQLYCKNNKGGKGGDGLVMITNLFFGLTRSNGEPALPYIDYFPLPDAKDPDNYFCIYIINSDYSYNLSVNNSIPITCCVVGGGGGGGNGRIPNKNDDYCQFGAGGGGGGGGQLVKQDFTPEKNINYTITIGKGGEGAKINSSTNYADYGQNGSNSSIRGSGCYIISKGGGGGKYGKEKVGGDGGTGGSGSNNGAQGGDYDNKVPPAGNGFIIDLSTPPVYVCGGGGGGGGSRDGYYKRDNKAFAGGNGGNGGGGGGGAGVYYDNVIPQVITKTGGKGTICYGIYKGEDGTNSFFVENFSFIGNGGNGEFGGGGGGSGTSSSENKVRINLPVFGGRGGDGIVMLRIYSKQ